MSMQRHLMCLLLAATSLNVAVSAQSPEFDRLRLRHPAAASAPAPAVAASRAASASSPGPRTDRSCWADEAVTCKQLSMS